MRRLIHLLNKNILLKIAGFNSIHIFLKIATGAIMSHLLAVYVGAAGMGVMGNLRNLVQGVYSFSVLGLQNGLVKHTAEYQANLPELKNVIHTGWTLMLVASLLSGIVVFFSANWLDAQLIAVETDFSDVFRVLALSLPFYVLFVLFTSLLQGTEQYNRFIWVNIMVSLLVFGISAIAIYQYNLTGALYALVIVPVVQALVAFGIWRTKSIQELTGSQLFSFSIDRVSAGKLLRYSVMALFSALMIPLVHILIRSMLIEAVSDEAAGWWEAVVRVSSYYMLFVTSLISLYLLPRLSKNASAQHYRTTIVRFYKNILPAVILGLISVYLCRRWIIELLFTAEFDPAIPMFQWQLMGDFVKVITTVLAFRFIAVNDLRRYLIAEVISIVSFYAFAWYAIPLFAEEGVVIAYLANYVVYLLVLLVMLRKDLFKG